MEVLLALVIGVLYGTGLYLTMRRNLIRVVLGLALLSNATNLLIFTAAGLTRGRPPLIAPDATILEVGVADPLPQALVLTAIVITFGVTAFALVLVYLAFSHFGTDDPDAMREAERLPPEEHDHTEASQ